MLEGINKLVDFVQEIGRILGDVINYIIDFFKGLLEFTTSLPDYIETANLYINAMPDAVKVIAISTMTMALIFVVVGRRGR